jgi:hypothetical protein
MGKNSDQQVAVNQRIFLEAGRMYSAMRHSRQIETMPLVKVPVRPSSVLGRTTGRGKASNSYTPNRSIKEILGLALTRRFRQLLSE